MRSGIPDDVRRFLLQSIDSVEQLEILLLLHGSPATDWSPDAVAQHLYSNPASVARRLAALQAKEALSTNDLASTYRYRPGTPDLDATITRLAEVYRQRRVAVITAIASKPMENVRAFSDAFRLRKKDQE
ncbi:MAG TPA: hypothetical protein VFS51_06165 [Gemmatimonadales bacterium]|nr:hypothetical protein [Gemmatimonadales bacterium]